MIQFADQTQTRHAGSGSGPIGNFKHSANLPAGLCYLPLMAGSGVMQQDRISTTNHGDHPEELDFHDHQIGEIDVAVEVRVAEVAVAIGVGVALIGVGGENAIVRAVGKPVAAHSRSCRAVLSARVLNRKEASALDNRADDA